MKFVVIAVLAVVWSAMPAIAQEPADPDVIAQALIARFAHAWDAADPRALGALFAPEADLVTPAGLVVTGRENIVRYYGAAFAAGYAGSHGTGQVLQHRMVAPGIDLLDGRFTISFVRDTHGVLQRPQSGMVCILLQSRGAAWQIVAWRERNGSGFTRFSTAPG